MVRRALFVGPLLLTCACAEPFTDVILRISVPAATSDALVEGPALLRVRDLYAEDFFTRELMEEWVCPGDDDLVFEASGRIGGCRVASRSLTLSLVHADDWGVSDGCTTQASEEDGPSPLYADLPIFSEDAEHPCSARTTPSVELDVVVTPELFE